MSENTNDTAAPSAPDTSFEESGKSSVTYKILAIVGMLIVIMVANAGFGIYQMGRIGDEIFEIAEHDLPLTGIVTKVTEHQLEQAIAL